MNINDCNLWIKDIDEVIKSIPWIEQFAGKTVMITGAGGLVCSPIVDILIRYNETHNIPVTIFVAARSEGRIKDRFKRYTDKDYFRIVHYDAVEPSFDLPISVDYIIHGASNSSPDKIIKEPVETMLSNFDGLYGLLRYAEKWDVKRILYISSSEVYGSKSENNPFQEDQYGYIDLLNSRNSYSIGKRAAETLCKSFADEYGVESVIMRPGHIYGPTALLDDKHVSSQWAYAAARGEGIVMKSDGAQIRSYCYCLDSATAILTGLIKGENCHAYNISNPNSVISIRQMAQLISRSAGVGLRMELPTEEEKRRFNPMGNSSLDATSLMNLGWKGCFDAKKGFEHTIQILRAMAFRLSGCQGE